MKRHDHFNVEQPLLNNFSFSFFSCERQPLQDGRHRGILERVRLSERTHEWIEALEIEKKQL